MEKKIIAIALVLVFMVTVFVGCSKGKKYIDDDGVEHLLHLDEEGNTILNDEGNLEVYVTKPNGSIKKDKDGKPMVGYVPFPEKAISGNTFETPYYKITLSEEWVLKEDGTFVRVDNENILINVFKVGKPLEADLKNLFDEQVKISDMVSEAVKKEYPIIEKNTVLDKFPNGMEYGMLEYKMYKKANGPVALYSNAIFFIYKDYLFQATLACKENSYDESINFYDIITENLELKK